MSQISAFTAWLILAAVVGAVFIILTTAHDPFTVNVGFSVLAGIITWSAVPALSEIFIKAGLKGMDLSKKTKLIIPESMGMVAGLIYLVTMFLFIPFPFMKWFTASRDGDPQELKLLTFPNLKLAELLSALLSIQSMVFLGFADDVLDIRWRFKMPLPAIASIPLLMVYWVNMGVTYIVVPIPLRPILGTLIDLGINGVEVGQSLVIACSIAVNDLLFINSNSTMAPAIETHLFSLYCIMPFIGVSTGLLFHNWYPSKVFIGDTYCYFAGMTFAVVGILAHYSKTLLLFFIPQIFNFLLSAPQLFRLVPCPRHRVPRYNRGTNLMEPSRVILDQEELDAEISQKVTQIPSGTIGRSTSSASLSAATSDSEEQTQVAAKNPSPSLSSAIQHTPQTNSRLSRPGLFCIKVLGLLRLTHIRYDSRTGQRPLEMTNLTLLNLILLKTGPLSERNLTISVMLIQVVCSIVAFFIRYRLAAFVYDIES
ncbi:UDP-N-acetylglucosamine--dolichyl-phosphate N-acetylglucosaminephosphotransferase [Mortierella sp. AM989]|nr:UDP-N-acetylglucosamine--dolichyl-phosphate N-acetylglucosaminephosphotransferase [Mortierella sp. AM989]